MNLEIEQIVSKAECDYWTLDLKENGLEYNPQDLKDNFLDMKISIASNIYRIDEIEFYSLRKDKVILKAIKL